MNLSKKSISSVAAIAAVCVLCATSTGVQREMSLFGNT